MNHFPRQEITGAILAGGQARRMGGDDKGLVNLNGRPMVEYILQVLTPQVGSIIINANRNQEHYARYGHAVIADNLGNYQGPLAGIASILEYAQTRYVLTVPCDGPLVPEYLAERLYAALASQDSDISIAHDGTRIQPMFALLKVSLLENLHDFLNAGERKVDLWYLRHKHALADFRDTQDAFLNINTPEQCISLSARLNG